MKYRVYFSADPIGETDHTGTNTFVQEKLSDSYLEWEILDTAAGKAFVESTQMIFAVDDCDESNTSPKRWVSWNHYQSVYKTDDEALEYIQQLHNDMDWCVEHDYIQFDDSYKVNYELAAEEFLNRLNRIHFAFESVLEDNHIQLTAEPQLFIVLERLNKLVHELEKTVDSKRWMADCFTVIRHSSDHVRHMFPKCTDEIYECFSQNTLYGDLFSDYFTVGKDMQAAYSTKDAELIRKQEVKSQTVISGSTAFACSEAFFGKPADFDDMWDYTSNLDRPDPPISTYDLYYGWAKSIGVSNYGYDITEPQHRLGRAPVGKLLHHTYESLKEFLKQHPFCCKVELIDE